jgi:hypothetical protein
MKHGLAEVDFKFNDKILIDEINQWRDRVPVHQGEDSNFPKEYYRVIKDVKQISEDKRYPEIQLPIAHQETERFLKHYSLINIDVRPRYFILKKDGYLPPHIDLTTQCSINTILSDPDTPVYLGNRSFDIHTEADEAAKIIKNIESTDSTKKHLTPLTYKTAALDTTRIHMVDNKGHNERLLFKISFFDVSYEELVGRVRG